MNFWNLQFAESLKILINNKKKIRKKFNIIDDDLKNLYKKMEMLELRYISPQEN